MILSSEESKKILDKVLSLSNADEAEVSLSDSQPSHLRFAVNMVTTSGSTQNLSLSVRSTFGTRSGVYTVNEFDETSLVRAVRKSEEIARLAPDDPEFMSELGPQQYVKVDAFDEETANGSAEARAEMAAVSIETSKEKNLISAGLITDSAGFNAIANSKGLFGYHKSTLATYSCTARTQDGTGSGWVGRRYNRVSDLNVGEFYAIAAEKALRSANPRPLEPGVYEVILEPSAAADMVEQFVSQSEFQTALDARNADEGRSYFSKKGGGNKIGEKLFSDSVTIYSDPSDKVVPGSPFRPTQVYTGGITWGDSIPQKKTFWVQNGVLKNLHYSRFWAQKQGKDPLPRPTNVIVNGGDATMEDLIKSVRRGVLVSAIWYIRSLDPQTILLTGLTRDGTFYIENGKIKYPVKNFRWNESPAFVLKNVLGMTKSMRVMGKESGSANISAPAMLVKEFHFASVSDAV